MCSLNIICCTLQPHCSRGTQTMTWATYSCLTVRRGGAAGAGGVGGLVELEFGLSGGVRCWLRSLKTALKALCFQLKHPSRITHTKTYLQPAKSGACYLQRAYKSHLAASGYGISLTHTHSSLISALLSLLYLFPPFCHCPPLVPPLWLCVK